MAPSIQHIECLVAQFFLYITKTIGLLKY